MEGRALISTFSLLSVCPIYNGVSFLHGAHSALCFLILWDEVLLWARRSWLREEVTLSHEDLPPRRTHYCLVCLGCWGQARAGLLEKRHGSWHSCWSGRQW